MQADLPWPQPSGSRRKWLGLRARRSDTPAEEGRSRWPCRRRSRCARFCPRSSGSWSSSRRRVASGWIGCVEPRRCWESRRAPALRKPHGRPACRAARPWRRLARGSTGAAFGGAGSRGGGGGRPPADARAARPVIVATAQRAPERKLDGTATWSLSTLERTLRREAFPRLGATTIRRVLHDAGSSYQQARTWCPTGTAERKRKSGIVRVTDPRTEEKRDDRVGVPHGGSG